MSYFLNSSFNNNEFQIMSKDKYFVDKTMLIEKINKLIGLKDRFVCITKPRRFGKTSNAMMLACYYSKNADLKNVFDYLDISKSQSYLDHLNKHNVVYISFNSNISESKTYSDYIGYFKSKLILDIVSAYPFVNTNDTLSDMLTQVLDETGEGFIFIIDEWDYIFNRNLFTEEDRKNFLIFLETLLKDKPYVELAYMTGILPIAKYSSASTINMFDEYTFINDYSYDKYFGFTNSEVEMLCKKQNKVSLNELKEWYNGYKTPNDFEIYNPRSVIYALKRGQCQSYWTNTGPMAEILYYVNSDIDSVKSEIVQMISGIPVEIVLKGYSAEQKKLTTKNQILSAMTIYGFLSYHDGELFIPNKELSMKFDEALEDKSMGAISEIVLKSHDMLNATLRKDTKTMEKLIQEAHDINIPVIKYNDENSLACVITLVYLSARDKYKIIREEKAGIGFADFIFYPHDKHKTAFIIELKKNSTPDEALRQIKEKRYSLALKDYTGQKLAIGISWDSKQKEHHVKIEEIDVKN